MNKIWIIIKREYWSRVSKRTFILTTLGLPIIMIGFSFLTGYLAAKSLKANKIALISESAVFNNFELGKKDSVIKLDNAEWPSIKTAFKNKGYDLLIKVDSLQGNLSDSSRIHVFTNKALAFETEQKLDDKINELLRANIMSSLNVNTTLYDSITNLNFEVKPITSDEKETNSTASMFIGQAICFLIYIVIFIYGTMVMRGVSEEKVNRIAEVMISSVKPFQLMMGKIIGIALVGLTQFFIWFLFISLISTVLGVVGMPAGLTHDVAANPAIQASATNMVQSALKGLNLTKIFFCFAFYFLGGYFLYASLFAVVGSMVNEDAQEAQSLTLPISLPIIIGLLIGMQAANNPDSGIAVFASIFPLTSPIVMMTRIAYDPPMWQVLLSMALLVVTFLGTTWLAAKIYRTSILMYGKKLTWAEAWKWVRQ